MKHAITEIPMPHMKDARIRFTFNTKNLWKKKRKNLTCSFTFKNQGRKRGKKKRKNELEQKKQRLDERFAKLRQSVLASNNHTPTEIKIIPRRLQRREDIWPDHPIFMQRPKRKYPLLSLPKNRFRHLLQKLMIGNLSTCNW